MFQRKEKYKQKQNNQINIYKKYQEQTSAEKKEAEDETYTHTPSDDYYCKKCLILRNRSINPIVKHLNKTKIKPCKRNPEV